MEFALNLILICCMFAIGSLFGSFFSLATYRIPRKQDITHSRSYCPNCKHRLEFFDLIPVLSYLFHGAKCKYCKDKISMRYFLLETGNGILFVLLYLLLGYTIQLAIVCIVYAVIFVLTGVHIMKNKMTDEEINEVKKLEEEKLKKKLSKKSGVFISELIIAVVLFILTFLTIIVVNRNTQSKSNVVLAEANANNLLIKNIEVCMLSDYDLLDNYTLTQDIDGIRYNVEVNVSKLSDNDDTKEDIIKKIDVLVSYNLNNKLYELNMKTLKGKV